MLQYVVLVREVPEEKAEKIRQAVSDDEPLAPKLFYPYRNQHYDLGFTGGELVIVDGDVILKHTVINREGSILDLAKKIPELVDEIKKM
jgi:hypothetical protein